MSVSQSQPHSFTGSISSPHVLATQAGQEAYQDGGNAIDAAIAAAGMLTVVYPHNVTLGGDLVALVRDPHGHVRCINATGWSGANASLDEMRRRHGNRLPVRGADTVTVPGGVRGWQSMLKLGGHLPLKRLLEPAARAAEIGMPVAASLARALSSHENSELTGDLGFDRTFYPSGAPLREGDILRQPALARTLNEIREHGADSFYTGDVAHSITTLLDNHGAQITQQDFADYSPRITDPIHITYGGLTVMTSPPNTHGFLLLRALHALESRQIEHPLTRDLDVFLQLFHHGNELRSTQLADPTFVNIDVDTLINANPECITPTANEPAAQRVAHGDTVGIATADEDGWAVSLIQSVYFAFGSGLLDPTTGVLLQNRGTSFSLDPNAPNVFAARKRPVHTLMPTMVLDGQALRYVLSTMGGQGQPQILAQVFLRALAGSSLERALAGPRAVVGAQSDGDTPDTVLMETDMSLEARQAVERTAFVEHFVPPRTEALGQTHAIERQADGSFEAACDPRADGSAIVVQYARHRRTA